MHIYAQSFLFLNLHFYHTLKQLNHRRSFSRQAVIRPSNMNKYDSGISLHQCSILIFHSSTTDIKQP